MSKILVDIYKDNYLVNKLGFKGGTSCYFFFELPRFSVDLDFNLINLPEFSPVEIAQIIQNITKILEKYGKVADQSTKQNTFFWLLNYEKEQWNLKVEVSTRNFGDKYLSREFLGLTIPVMSPEYIFAHKLTALTDRRHPVGRDVFDINYFITKNWNFKADIIELRTGLNPTEYLASLPDFITANFTNKNILDGVGELLDETSRQHYKSNLIDEVVTNLRLLLENYDAYAV